MSHPPKSVRSADMAIKYYIESLKSLTGKGMLAEREILPGAIEEFEDEGFSPFPQEGLLNEEDLKSMEINFQEHNRLKPHLEGLLNLLSQKEVDGGENEASSLNISSSERIPFVDALRKAQSDVETIQGQLSYMINHGLINSELEKHAKLLHEFTTSGAADFLPEEIKEALEKGKPQFEQIVQLSDEHKTSEDTKLPPISSLKISENPREKNNEVQRTRKPKKHLDKPIPKAKKQLPEYLPYEPDECILCEYFHVFGKHPVNLIKACDKILDEEIAMKNNLEIRARPKKRRHHKKI